MRHMDIMFDLFTLRVRLLFDFLKTSVYFIYYFMDGRDT